MTDFSSATWLRTLLAVIALQHGEVATVIAQSPKTGDWLRATPSPIERVEAPTPVLDKQL